MAERKRVVPCWVDQMWAFCRSSTVCTFSAWSGREHPAFSSALNKVVNEYSTFEMILLTFFPDEQIQMTLRWSNRPLRSPISRTRIFLLDWKWRNRFLWRYSDLSVRTVADYNWFWRFWRSAHDDYKLRVTRHRIRETDLTRSAACVLRGDGYWWNGYVGGDWDRWRD